jgi:hypothetical protein
MGLEILNTILVVLTVASMGLSAIIADRYRYLPQLGFLLISGVMWGVSLLLGLDNSTLILNTSIGTVIISTFFVYISSYKQNWGSI